MIIIITFRNEAAGSDISSIKGLPLEISNIIEIIPAINDDMIKNLNGFLNPFSFFNVFRVLNGSIKIPFNCWI